MVIVLKSVQMVHVGISILVIMDVHMVILVRINQMHILSLIIVVLRDLVLNIPFYNVNF